MAAEAKVIITGDASQAVGAANKLGDAVKKSAEHAGGLGRAIERANHHLISAAGRALSLVAAFEGAAKSVEKINENIKKGIDANKKEGGEILKRAQALAKIGVSDIGGGANFVSGIEGAASAEERTKAVEDFASFSGSARVKPSQRQFYDYMRLSASGLYSNEELLERLKRGESLPSGGDASGRFNALPEAAQSELFNRMQEYSDEQSSIGARSGGNSRGNRLAESRIERLRAEHPGLMGFADVVRETAGSLPVVGSAISADIEMNQRRNMRMMMEHMGAIRDSNERMSYGSLNLSGSGVKTESK